MKKSKCYECKFKKSIPGNAHIKCTHPDITVPNSPLLDVISIAGGLQPVDPALKKMGLKVNKHGAQMGWCTFPLNYDPVWLEGNCKGFEEKD